MQEIDRIIKGLEKIATFPDSNDFNVLLQNYIVVSEILTKAANDLQTIKFVVESNAVKDMIKAGYSDCLTINKTKLKRKLGF